MAAYITVAVLVFVVGALLLSLCTTEGTSQKAGKPEYLVAEIVDAPVEKSGKKAIAVATFGVEVSEVDERTIEMIRVVCRDGTRIEAGRARRKIRRTVRIMPQATEVKAPEVPASSAEQPAESRKVLPGEDSLARRRLAEAYTQPTETYQPRLNVVV